MVQAAYFYSTVFFTLFALVLSSPINTPDVVAVGYASFQGNTTEQGIIQFLGIPYAAPPVGSLRFQVPQRPPPPLSGTQQALNFGAACPQQSVPPVQGVQLFTPANNTSEDCLFLNIVKPSEIDAGQQLPVLVWIFGGGFTDGDAAQDVGNTVVQRSIALGEPIIYVSLNYRLNALGFLGGAEVKAAGVGNLGLRDQRFALQWVHDNIAAFGGDPSKVTIWGESAGASSVGLHLVVNDGDTGGLFRGAVMQSGSPSSLKDITAMQAFYDQLVDDTGCAGERDTLECLRNVPIDQLMDAVNLSPNIASFSGLNLPWQPVIDGQFIARNPLSSLANGQYAKVPFITGDCDDEGTAFSLTTLNITTDQEFLDYMQSNYFSPTTIGNDTLQQLGQLYPSDPTVGSPFNTGTANAITPQFKRFSAVLGDLFFQVPRRNFLQASSGTQPAFAFLFQRNKTTPFLGSFHSADIPEFYGAPPSTDFIGTDALISFATNLNPNTQNPLSLLSAIQWNEWSSNTTAPPLFTFIDPAPTVSITTDTFRVDGMNLLQQIIMEVASLPPADNTGPVSG